MNDDVNNLLQNSQELTTANYLTMHHLLNSEYFIPLIEIQSIKTTFPIRSVLSVV